MKKEHAFKPFGPYRPYAAILHYNGHQTRLKTFRVAFWLLRWLVDPVEVHFLGHRTKWFYYPSLKPVTNTKHIEVLMQIEHQAEILSSFNNNAKVINP